MWLEIVTKGELFFNKVINAAVTAWSYYVRIGDIALLVDTA